MTRTQSTAWITVAAVEEVPADRPLAVEAGGRQLVLVRSGGAAHTSGASIFTAEAAGGRVGSACAAILCASKPGGSW